MNNQAGFIIKILLLSAGLSILIKYGGQHIPIQPTTSLAIIIVLLPSLVTGLVMGWRVREIYGGKN